MSAAILREAAALMRERVAEMKAECGLKPTAPASEIPWFELTDDYADSGVLAWCPAVQIAVADWLDAEAASLDSMAVFTGVAATIEHEVHIRGAALTVRKDEKGGISLTADTSAPALAVATAYLGDRP